MAARKKIKEEAIVVFINEFKTKNKDIDMNGHLREGSIYMCMKHEDRGRVLYRIFFNDKEYKALDGIFVSGLEEDNSSWSIKMEELDFANIDKYKLHDDDLNYAIDIKNMTLKEAKEFMDVDKTQTDNDFALDIFQKLDDALMDAAGGPDEMDMKVPEEYEEFIFDEPEGVDSETHKAFDEILHHVEKTFKDKYQNSVIDTMPFLMEKDHGHAINVFNSVKYLSRYMTTGFEKSRNKVDLYKAAHYIIFEIIRNNKYNK
jgi:hypothetical protein